MKKSLSLIFILNVLLFSAEQSYTQNKKIDSLLNVLKNTKQDTSITKAYVALTEELYLSHIDTVIPLCNKAIQIIDAKLPEANDLEKKSFLTSKADALNNMGYVYKHQGNVFKALELYNKSLKLREEIGDKHGIANSLNNIGLIYDNQGDILMAIECYKKGLKIQNEIGDRQGMAISQSNIGFIYKNQFDIPKALEWYHKSLIISEEIGNKHGIAISLSNIGQVYHIQGDFSKSLEWYQKSLKILEEVGDKKGISTSLNNIGSVYKGQGDISKALEYYQKSLKIKQEIGEKEGIARAFNNIGDIYSTQAENEQNPDSISNKYNKALEWIQKSLSIWKEIGDKLGITNSLYNISGIYFKQANSPLVKNGKELYLKKAEEYCKASLQTAKELENPEQMRNASDRLSIIYKIMGKLAYVSGNKGLSAQKYKDALEMEELFKLASDKINNIEAQKLTLKMQMQSEFEKKESISKAEQEKKDSLAQIEKQKQKLFLWSVACGFLLVIVFSFFMFNRWRISQKQKSIIEKQKEKIIDSITYAQSIQQCILMEEREIQIYLPDSFIYYQPKDIVSGDFYWCTEVHEKIVIAAADCTGHGVPGAFMSMIGNTLLNQIVIEKNITMPSEILKLLNIGIYETLHQGKEAALSCDGMDIALISIDFKNNQIDYAGAQNPLYIIKDNNVEIIKADRQTIGGGGLITKKADPNKVSYTNHTIPLKMGMCIYLFSDGYMDQFGGKDRKKFGTQKFKELILSSQHLSMQKQKEFIAKAHEEWKENKPQIDDILVIGIKI